MASGDQGHSPTNELQGGAGSGLRNVLCPERIESVRVGGNVDVLIYLPGGEVATIRFGVVEAQDLSDKLVTAWAAAEGGRGGNEVEAAERLFPHLQSCRVDELARWSPFRHAFAWGTAPLDFGRIMLAVALELGDWVPPSDAPPKVAHFILPGEGRTTAGLLLRAAALAQAHRQGLNVEAEPSQ